MFHLVASAATLIFYHTLSYLVNNFFNFFKAVCCYVIDCLCVTSCSRSQLDYNTILEHKCQQLFQTFLQIIHILFTRCKNPSLAFHFHGIYNENISILFRYYS